MLARLTFLILVLLVLGSAVSAGDAPRFRIRLYEGHPSLPASDPHKKVLADFQVVAGREFSVELPESYSSVSGSLSAVDAWPRFTGHVKVRTTSTDFKSAPVVDRLLRPQFVHFSGYIQSFYLSIERI